MAARRRAREASRRGPGRSSAAVGVPAESCRRAGVTGTVVGRADRAAAARSGSVPASRSSAGPSTPSRATTAPACCDPGDASTRAARPAASGSTGTSRSRSPGGSSRSRRWPGRYSVGAAMAATGRALDWYRDEDPRRRRSRTEALIEEAATTPPGADGLVFLPYLAGERSPFWDPTARGVFAGLTLGARPRPPRPGDPRGVGARDPPRRRADARGRRDASTRCASAAARPGATTWNQIKADVTGFPVAVPEVLETAVAGLGDARRGRDRRLPRHRRRRSRR